MSTELSYYIHDVSYVSGLSSPLSKKCKYKHWCKNASSETLERDKGVYKEGTTNIRLINYTYIMSLLVSQIKMFDRSKVFNAPFDGILRKLDLQNKSFKIGCRYLNNLKC